MCNLICIYKWHMELLSNDFGRFKILSMSINERVAVYFFIKIVELRISQRFIICQIVYLTKEVPTHYSIKQHRNASSCTGFIHKALEVLIERATWFRVSVWILFFIIMSKLNKDIVTWLYLFEYPLPSAFINETFGRSSVNSMIVYHDVICEV